jgi:hypothetical protein
MIALICLRVEDEISTDSLLDDLRGVVAYPLDPDQIVHNLHHLRRTGLVEVDWRKGIVKRQPAMKGYVDKLAKSEIWPKVVDDWRRIGSLVQTRYHQINPECQELIQT